MNKEKGKNNYKIKKILSVALSYSNHLSWMISILILTTTVVILTHNFVNSLIDLRALSGLKGQVALKVVNLKKWEQVNQAIKWKEQPLQNGDLDNNPFE